MSSKVFFPVHRITFRCRGSYLTQFSPLRDRFPHQTDNDTPVINEVSLKLQEKSQELFKRKISFKEFENLVQYLAQEENGILSLVLLKCCCNFIPHFNFNYKLKMGKDIMRLMKKKKQTITNEHFEALLRCYIDNNHPLNLENFLTELNLNNIKLDERLCSLILKCLCVNKQLNDANVLLTKLKENGISLNEENYSDLMYGYGKSRNLEKVNELFKTMLKSDLSIGAGTYTTLLKVYSENGNLKLLRDHYNFLQNNGVELSEVQVLEVIESLALSKHFSLLPVVWNWKKSYDLQHLKHTLYKLISFECFEGTLVFLDLIKNSYPELLNFCKTVIHQAVFANYPLDSIISLAIQSIEWNLDAWALHHVLFFSFYEKADWDSIKILNEMKKMEIPIKSHFIWPILIQDYDKKGEAALFKSLRLFETLKLNFDLSTMINIVFPRIDINDHTCEKLFIATKWPKPKIILSLFFYYFKAGKVSEAANLVKDNEHILDRLTKRSWLNYMAKGVLSSSNVSGLSALLMALNPSKVDTFLITLGQLYSGAPQVPNCFTEVLEELNKHQWKISYECFEGLVKSLQLTSYQKALLKELVDSDLPDLDFYHDQRAIKSNSLIIELLEGIFKQGIKNEELAKSVSKRIFLYYCYMGNMKEALKFRQKMIENDVPFDTAVLKLAMFVLYVKNKDLANSKQCYEALNREYPNFKISLYYVLQYSALLVEKGLCKDSLRIINEKKFKILNTSGIHLNMARLMEAVGKHKSVELLKEFIEALDGYVKWSNYILNPVVRSFVERGDLNTAVEVFCFLSSRCKVTPCLLPLLNLALNEEDENALRKIRQASLNIIHKKTFMMEMLIAILKTGDTQKLNDMLGKQFFLNQKWRNKLKKFALKSEIEELTNFYLVLEHPEIKTLLLSCIIDSYERKLDYQGAENLIRHLEEKGETIPQKFSDRIKKFKPG